MPPYFAQAREFLEHAWLKLSGNDETSVASRQALDLFIAGLATAECAKKLVMGPSSNTKLLRQARRPPSPNTCLPGHHG